MIGVKYCIFDPSKLIFIRPLVLLISNILCCFSILVYCRSLVQIGVQMGEIEQKMEVWPLPMRSVSLGAIERTAIERMSHDRA
jgi:hypothetical protein